MSLMLKARGESLGLSEAGAGLGRLGWAMTELGYD